MLRWHPAPPIVALALVGAATSTLAQQEGFSLDLNARAEAGGELLRRRTRTSGQPDRDFDRDRLEEKIGLEARGWLFRTDLLRFRLDGDFGLRHEWPEQTGLDLGRDRGRIFEYDGYLDFFSEAPVALSLFGSRFEDRLIQGFGADTEVSGDTLGATLRFRNRYLPSTLSRRRLRSIADTLGPTPTRRDEVRDILTYAGNYHSRETQVRLHYRDEDVDDRSRPPIGDYRVREASAQFGKRWGDYLEHAFRTSLRGFRRTGNFERDTYSSSNSYLWEVTDRLTTDVRYDFNRFDSSQGVTKTQLALWTLRHELYETLTSGLRVFGDRASQSNGVRSQYGAGISLDYRKLASWGSRLLADFRFRQTVQDTDLDSSIVQVNGESLLIDVPPNFLENARVVAGSIVVMDVFGNPLLEGVDYEVLPIGDRTSIEALPGGAITPPETVRVDYSFEVPRDAKILNTSLGYAIGWDLGWLLVRYQHGQTDERLLGGDAEAFLQDSRLDAYRVLLRRETPSLRASAGFSFEEERSTSIDRDEWTFDQNLLWKITSRLDFNVNLREGRTEIANPDRETTILALNSRLDWRISRNHRVQLFARVRSLDDSLSEDQLDTILGARGDFRFGRIQILPSLRWTLRDRDPTRVTELRGGLRLRWSM